MAAAVPPVVESYNEDELEFLLTKPYPHIIALNHLNTTLNVWNANWRGVYRFLSTEYDDEATTYKCSFLKLCFSETFEAFGASAKGGFIRVPCTESFRSREELRVHSFLHHYDFVVKRVEVKSSEKQDALKISLTGRAFHLGLAPHHETPTTAFPVTGETGRFFEDRVALACRTCPHLVDCAKLVNNFTFLAAHQPISAGLSYQMIKQLFLDPSNPGAEYKFSLPLGNHRLVPLSQQNNQGMMRSLVVEEKGNFEFHDCRDNLISFLKKNAKKRYSNLGWYHYCEVCQSKFATYAHLRNHLRIPHHKLSQGQDTANDVFYAPHETDRIKRSCVKGLKDKSDCLHLLEDRPYFIGRCGQYRRYQHEEPLDDQYDNVIHVGCRTSSGILPTPKIAKDEDLKRVPAYFTHADYRLDSRFNTSTLPLKRKQKLPKKGPVGKPITSEYSSEDEAEGNDSPPLPFPGILLSETRASGSNFVCPPPSTSRLMASTEATAASSHEPAESAIVCSQFPDTGLKLIKPVQRRRYPQLFKSTAVPSTSRSQPVSNPAKSTAAKKKSSSQPVSKSEKNAAASTTTSESPDSSQSPASTITTSSEFSHSSQSSNSKASKKTKKAKKGKDAPVVKDGEELRRSKRPRTQKKRYVE
ncbi:hypothetical protein TYRP_023144 [Tyrophagus putrescentiae]|nr:hypothetical protein TYRP_023144 [Tyrophagus putrescentiae]